MSFPDLMPELADWAGDIRGNLIANHPLASVSWFRVGGPAQLFFEPANESDLALFLKNLPAHINVLPIGLGSNLLIRDGGIEGVAK